MKTSMLGSIIILQSLSLQNLPVMWSCLKITAFPGFSHLYFLNWTFQSHGHPIKNITILYHGLCSWTNRFYICPSMKIWVLGDSGTHRPCIATSSIPDLRKAPIKSCCLFVLRHKARLIREDCQDTPLLPQLQAPYGSPCVTERRLLTLSISFCV